MNNSNVFDEPGAKQTGDYFHIVLRDESQYVKFRYQDVGDKGEMQRLGGMKADGTWETQKWIVAKDMAHLEGNTLVADHQDAKNLFDKEFATPPILVTGDIFQAEPK